MDDAELRCGGHLAIRTEASRLSLSVMKKRMILSPWQWLVEDIKEQFGLFHAPSVRTILKSFLLKSAPIS